MGEEQAKKRGRPKGRFNPAIDWGLAESLFVFGEPDETGTVVFPSFSAIGLRAGTTKANVQQRCKRFNWGELREKALTERGLPRPDKKTVAGVGATADPEANPRGRPRRSPETILLETIHQFDRNLRRGKVPLSVGDLDKAVRLLAFVRGEADSRKATHTVISLEVLQKKYRETRQTIDTVGEEVTGVIHGGGEGYSLDGEEEHDAIGDAAAMVVVTHMSPWQRAAARVAASVE